eukprot:m.36203 g.36203  ORF g.36203 m.36203 type:complete len:310 (-) comp12460_c0_seq2:123-1052(-)
MPRFRLRSRSQIWQTCCGTAGMAPRSLCKRLLLETSWPALLVGLLYLVISTQTLPVQGRNWIVTEDNIGVYSYPYAGEEHVPTYAFMLWGLCLAPYMAAIEMYYVTGDKGNDRIVFAVNIGLTFLEGFIWTAASTEILKAWVAEPRPDFRDRCFGGLKSQVHFVDGHVDCTHDIGDGDQSWPSGHSSCSLYFGAFSTMFSVWVVYIRQRETPFRTASGTWKSHRAAMLTEVIFLFCFWPLMLGGWIATSRIVDHRHSPADVITGCVMGLVFASLFFVRLLSRVPERQANTQVRTYDQLPQLSEDDNLEL